jgi:hypothetical protein
MIATGTVRAGAGTRAIAASIREKARQDLLFSEVGVQNGDERCDACADEEELHCGGLDVMLTETT